MVMALLADAAIVTSSPAPGTRPVDQLAAVLQLPPLALTQLTAESRVRDSRRSRSGESERRWRLSVERRRKEASLDNLNIAGHPVKAVQGSIHACVFRIPHGGNDWAN